MDKKDLLERKLSHLSIEKREYFWEAYLAFGGDGPKKFDSVTIQRAVNAANITLEEGWYLIFKQELDRDPEYADHLLKCIFEKFEFDGEK